MFIKLGCTLHRVSDLIHREAQTELEGIKACVHERMFMYIVSLERWGIKGGNRNPSLVVMTTFVHVQVWGAGG